MRIRQVMALVVLAVMVASGPLHSEEVKLAPRSVLDGKVVLLVPASFEIMSEEMRRLKYPSERRPPIVFTNYEGSVNVSIKPTEHRMVEATTESMRFALVRGYKANYPSSEIFSEPIVLGGRLGFFIDFWVTAQDTDIRIWIVGISVEDRLVMISFNVTRKLEPEWMGVAEKIMASIDIVE